ncbi:hypothetical protein D9M71_322450 [compost metagenome]
MHHAIADRQCQGQAQGVAEQQRGRCQLLAQAAPDVLEVTRRTVEQAAVAGIGEVVGVAGVAEQAVKSRQVRRQCAQRTQ